MATKFTANPDLDVLKEEKDGKVREVGNQAVWSLSSCKPGTVFGENNNMCKVIHDIILVILNQFCWKQKDPVRGNISS